MVRFDLWPLLQGQTRIAKFKSAYNSLIIFFFLSFIHFFFQKQVKVLHEANIQKRSNIDILINTVKKKSLQTKQKNNLHINYLVMHTDTKSPKHYHCR